MSILITVLLAVLLDLVLGEPRKEIHPTVWFGRLISFFDGRYSRRGKIDLLAGAFFSLTVILFAFLLSLSPHLLPQPLGVIFAAFLLKTTFSIKSLEDHVKNTAVSDLNVKRKRVSMIVSRDSTKLTRTELNSAAIESLAENIVDSVISPLLYFVLLGLPGAMVYRAVNTLDAMIGYRDKKYSTFGKFGARLDDLLNFIPARIAILLFLPLSKRVWEYYKMARFKLNGDKPISAMSAVLGVKLEKKGSYLFPGRDPDDADILKALKVFRIVVFEWLIIVLLLLLAKDLYI